MVTITVDMEDVTINFQLTSSKMHKRGCGQSLMESICRRSLLRAWISEEHGIMFLRGNITFLRNISPKKYIGKLKENQKKHYEEILNGLRSQYQHFTHQDQGKILF